MEPQGSLFGPIFTFFLPTTLQAFRRLKSEMMSLELSTSSAQERPSKPKSRLLDFNESDESLEEEDRLDTELSSLLLGKLSICNL